MDTIWRIIGCIVGCLMCLIVGNVGFLVCAWFVHVVVRILTLGRVQLDWHKDSECFLTQWIGIFFMLAIAGLIEWAVHR